MKEPLSVTHPHLASEWDAKKNDELTPDSVYAGSNKKVWWKCNNGPDHEWQATIEKRTRHGFQIVMHS